MLHNRREKAGVAATAALAACVWALPGSANAAWGAAESGLVGPAFWPLAG